MFRAGLYPRDSPNDPQPTPLQIRATREYAARLGWTIALEGERDRLRSISA
jgi:hypothetical protein